MIKIVYLERAKNISGAVNFLIAPEKLAYINLLKLKSQINFIFYSH